uniref:ATP synthase subunit a n=1 Tax=Brachycerus muricatus TaxID=159793 RepID=J9PJ50_9CUCU|nr:ATP synthase F0 subunit 6 [Brachycerus muricatus]
MTNLFSIFDPSTSTTCSFNWLSLTMWFILFTPMYWMLPSRMNMLWIKLLFFMNNSMSSPKMNSSFKGSNLMIISVFCLILLNNFMGIFPYIFTSTTHLSITLSLSLPLWLTFIIFSYTNNLIHMLAHKVPYNTPLLMSPFMVMIETLSILMRPSTLAIRLMANMMAGHLILELIGLMGVSMMDNISISWILIILQMILLILEMTVAIIQAYVFFILILMYSKEAMNIN